MSQQPEIRKRVVVENTTGHPLTLVLEPWANEYPMAPGDQYVIEGEGSSEDAEFYTEVADDYYVVWAWEGSDARVLREDGSVVADWTGLRVPKFCESNRTHGDATQAG